MDIAGSNEMKENNKANVVFMRVSRMLLLASTIERSRSNNSNETEQ
jgi:hypothetical protein